MYKKENKQSPENLIPGYLQGDLSDDEIHELVDWIKLNSSN